MCATFPRAAQESVHQPDLLMCCGHQASRCCCKACSEQQGEPEQNSGIDLIILPITCNNTTIHNIYLFDVSHLGVRAVVLASYSLQPSCLPKETAMDVALQTGAKGLVRALGQMGCEISDDGRIGATGRHVTSPAGRFRPQ